MRRPLLFLLVPLLVLAIPAAALAATAGTPDPVPTTRLVLPTDQLWAFVAGQIAPLAAYALNYRAPWVSEPVKAVALAVVAAVAGGLTQAITAGDVGFNDVTLQFVVTAVIGALLAHTWFWQRSEIAFKLGAGRNRQVEAD